MCIIIAKPEGVKIPSDSIFRNSWLNNPDGAGIMYAKDGLVTIQKGLMSYKAFDGTLNKLKKTLDTTKTPMVFHFRITTHGPSNAQNTHPFPLSDDVDLLQRLRLKTRLGIAHNGVITLAGSCMDCKTLSDTQVFIKDYLSIIARDTYFYKKAELLTLIERLIKSKMTFLTRDGLIINIGRFEEVEGCFYSNDSYLDSYWGGYSGYFNGYKFSDYFKSPSQLSKEDTGLYVKKLMWLGDEHYIIKDNDFIPLSSSSYLLDKTGLLYIYNFEEDVAYYHSCSTVYDSKIRPVKYDPSKTESLYVTAKRWKKKKKV